MKIYSTRRTIKMLSKPVAGNLKRIIDTKCRMQMTGEPVDQQIGERGGVVR